MSATDQMLCSMLNDSARRLGLPFDDPRMIRARETGQAALDTGHSTDIAFEAARRVLLDQEVVAA